MSKLLEVEIFWDGDGYYFANHGDSDRLGGPHIKIHAAWKEADEMGLEVVRVTATRGLRTYRNPLPVPEKKADTNGESEDVQPVRKA